MKWLLPEPNDPLRNAPRLTPVVIASADEPKRTVERLYQRRRDHIIVDRDSDPRRVDAVREPQHVVLGPGGSGMSRTSLSSSLTPHLPCVRGLSRLLPDAPAPQAAKR